VLSNQREVTGLVNGLAAALQASVDPLVADMELELAGGPAPRDLP